MYSGGMRKNSPTLFIASALILVIGGFLMGGSAFAASENYLAAQKGLSYSLYRPVNTLGFAQSKFQKLMCGGGGEDWIYVNFIKGKKSIETMQTRKGAHCSNPGLSTRMPSIKINGVAASVFVYCDPTKPSATKKCSITDISKVGGYIFLTLPGYYGLKPTDMQVQVTGGISYEKLVSVAKSFTPASTQPSK
jgi:hypothetical protein